MSLFGYQARTTEGERQAGTVEAGSREAAIETLHRHALIITHLEDLSARSMLARDFTLPFLGGVSAKEIVVFSRQLSVLFGARVPLVESLTTLAEQATNRALRKIIEKIAADVDGGMSFSATIEKHNIFSRLYVSIVKSGEVSGKLQEVLEYLATNLEREYRLTQKVRGAMMYPALVIFVFGVVFVLMTIFIIPNIKAIFEESEAQLPFITRVVLGMSDFVKGFWWLLVIGGVAGIAAFTRYTRTKEGKRWWDRTYLHFPIVGNLAKQIYVARFSDNLSTLITSGIPITQALEVAGEVVGNARFQEIIADATAAVRRGESIHGILRMHPAVIPLMVGQMVEVGEKTGKLDTILEHIARFYQNEVDTAVDNLVQLIEPLLIVVLGLGVALLVTSILLPIYNLAGVIG